MRTVAVLQDEEFRLDICCVSGVVLDAAVNAKAHACA